MIKLLSDFCSRGLLLTDPYLIMRTIIIYTFHSMTTHQTQSMQLAEATAGHTYQVCRTDCTDAMSQKLTLMGLGLGMMIELIALYSHGAVVRTPFGHMAVGSDLVTAISVTPI